MLTGLWNEFFATNTKFLKSKIMFTNQDQKRLSLE